MGNFLVTTVMAAYLGVLATPVLQANTFTTTLNEKTCSAYDEKLVNGRCEISMDKIPFCPGSVVGSVCVTEAASLN